MPTIEVQSSSAGKGPRPRPYSPDAYEEGYQRIFGKKKRKMPTLSEANTIRRIKKTKPKTK